MPTTTPSKIEASTLVEGETLAADCACANAIDDDLAKGGWNTRLARTINFSTGTARPTIMTEQIETGRGKKKAATLAPSFCPFCGTRYPKVQP